MMNKKKNSTTKLHTSQFVKILVLLPCILFLVFFVIGLLFELIFGFKKPDSTYTSQNVRDARVMFVLLSVPIFSWEFIAKHQHEISFSQVGDERMLKCVELYGKRPYVKWAQMYFPFSQKYDLRQALKKQTNLDVLVNILGPVKL